MSSNDRPQRPSGKPEGKRPPGRKPAGQKSDRPRFDSSRSDKPRSDKPRSDRPRSDKPRSDSPRSDRPRTGGPRSDSPRTDRPRSDSPRSDRPRSDRPRSDAPRSDRPRSDRPRTDRPRTDGPRSDRPRSDRPRSDRPSGEGSRGGPREGFRSERSGERPKSFGRPGSDRPRPPRDGARETRPREVDEPRHDDPPVAEDALPGELDRAAWRELKALTKENAEWVAGHLVMASRVVDEDPERAHKHAMAASRRAGRIPVVRETLGITAYLMGDFALALRELRTYRRLSGSNDQLPLMVDCERGLGRPERALELASDVDRASLSVAVQDELAIARSGARLDLGQAELALAELEIPQLTPDTVYSFSPALFDSYAVVLAELGREAEAATWGEHANRAAEALEEAASEGVEDMVDVLEIAEEEQ